MTRNIKIKLFDFIHGVPDPQHSISPGQALIYAGFSIKDYDIIKLINLPGEEINRIFYVIDKRYSSETMLIVWDDNNEAWTIWGGFEFDL